MQKKENLLFTAWAASLTAMLGSLYFSEIVGYEPCELCWYQRILMYPIVLILGIAVVKKDLKAAVYSLAFSAIGALVSLYHYGLQKVDFLTDAAPACGRVPCTGMYINWFGFVTIPFLALTAFVIIFITSLMILKRKGE
ncbi:disulfide oxidoreductase [Domibacillus enclensis]|uniref:Probable disulfide formation protein n=1 Tax=Domibacillus enclensis TaxID=1017273 RepID=A0A1N7B441_9BACI|nr:disulfide oxidoreductase [Domibacillus enclensis]OXS75176.1 disulfide bond formation protein B [Domibacillus enclensis]SIR46013.1 Thiol:disulfide interchange protein DsbB [Domibacillus enclensis]